MEFEVVIAAGIFIIVALFANKLLRCIVNPITVFCGMWGIILLLYSFHAYGVYYASQESLLLVVTGVAMFCIGGMMAMSVFHVQKKCHAVTRGMNPTAAPMQYQVILILNIISFAFLIGFGMTAIRQLLSGVDFYYIHKMYNDEEGMIAGSTVYKNMISWFVWPLTDASLAAVAAAIICDRKNKNKTKNFFIAFTLANLFLFTVISGKRVRILNFAVFILAAFFMERKKVKLKKKTKKWIAVAVIAAAGALTYISMGRGNESIIRTLYIYFVGCIPHLSAKMESIPEVVGMTSIYGFFQPIIIIVNLFARLPLLTSIRNSMIQLTEYTQIKAMIGPGMKFNAFLSPFYFFYLDGGMLGNILLSFAFGFFSMIVYYLHLKKHSYHSLINYLLIFFSLYMSMVRMQFFQMRYVLSFFYAYLFFMKPMFSFRSHITSKRKG